MYPGRRAGGAPDAGSAGAVSTSYHVCLLSLDRPSESGSDSSIRRQRRPSRSTARASDAKFAPSSRRPSSVIRRRISAGSSGLTPAWERAPPTSRLPSLLTAAMSGRRTIGPLPRYVSAVPEAGSVTPAYSSDFQNLRPSSSRTHDSNPASDVRCAHFGGAGAWPSRAASGPASRPRACPAAPRRGSRTRSR